MASFEEILKKPASEIKTPPPIPVGTYHCLVDGIPEHGKSTQKGTDYFRFKYKILAPKEDVDAKAAAEQQVVGKIVNHDQYLTDNVVTQAMLKDFLMNSLGIEEGANLEVMVAEAPGKQLLVTIKHDVTQDGKRSFARVHATAHV